MVQPTEDASSLITAFRRKEHTNDECVYCNKALREHSGYPGYVCPKLPASLENKQVFRAINSYSSTCANCNQDYLEHPRFGHECPQAKLEKKPTFESHGFYPRCKRCSKLKAEHDPITMACL